MKKQILFLKYSLIFLFILAGNIMPVFSKDVSFEVSGWVPYWRLEEGIQDARKHLDVLSYVYPFAYSVQTDGSLKDLADVSGSLWQKLIKSAKSKDVQVIPTIMWSDTATIHTILSDKNLRAGHIKAIIKMISSAKFSGVDIDYEAKRAETKEYFSLFIKELKLALGSKTLICTIESRIPPESMYRVAPTTLQYANDYAVIGKYCDRVQIMAYDQGRIDLKLNDARRGAPYNPISDIAWVRKVMEYTIKFIPKEKLILGVATYGREFEVTVSPNWFKSYKIVHSLNMEDAEKLADEYNITPSRNSAGEMSFSYQPLSSKISLPGNGSVSSRALAYANSTGKTITFNFVSWSDAEAISKKVELAHELGLGGIAIFKIDGKEDLGMWNTFDK